MEDGAGPAVDMAAAPPTTEAYWDSDDEDEGTPIDMADLVDRITDCVSGQCEGSTGAAGEMPPGFQGFMSLITGQSQEDAKAIEEAVCDRLREIQADAERQEAIRESRAPLEG